MTWFSSKVKVTLIDDATGQSFGVTKMPPDDLPETFELATTLHLGDDDWRVVDAQPKTRAEYAKCKTLTLHLRRVEKIDPSKLLYTLATICDRAPPLGDGLSKPSDGDFSLHEDDWRQIEFVSANDREYLTAQVAKVRQFKVDNWTGRAWKNIFVRPDHPTELASLNIAIEDLKNALSECPQNGVLVFQSFSDPTGSARAVLGGFSFRVNNGTMIYGHQINGTIATLAAHVYVENVSEVETISQSFRSIAQLSPLLLVDWNSDSLVTLSESEKINQWLMRLANGG